MKNKECPTRKKKTGKGKQKKQEEKRVATEGAVNKIFCPQIMKSVTCTFSNYKSRNFASETFKDTGSPSLVNSSLSVLTARLVQNNFFFQQK